MITPRACAMGKVIGFVCRRHKIARSQHLVSEQAVSTTKLSKMVKNLLMFTSNRIACLTSATSRGFFLTTPINHTVHVLSTHVHKLVRHWQVKVTNNVCCAVACYRYITMYILAFIIISLRYDAARTHGVCALENWCLQGNCCLLRQ